MLKAFSVPRRRPTIGMHQPVFVDASDHFRAELHYTLPQNFEPGRFRDGATRSLVCYLPMLPNNRVSDGAAFAQV
jgi:hypothetical protein